MKNIWMLLLFAFFMCGCCSLEIKKSPENSASFEVHERVDSAPFEEHPAYLRNRVDELLDKSEKMKHQIKELQENKKRKEETLGMNYNVEITYLAKRLNIDNPPYRTEIWADGRIVTFINGATVEK